MLNKRTMLVGCAVTLLSTGTWGNRDEVAAGPVFFVEINGTRVAPSKENLARVEKLKEEFGQRGIFATLAVQFEIIDELEADKKRIQESLSADKNTTLEQIEAQHKGELAKLDASYQEKLAQLAADHESALTQVSTKNATVLEEIAAKHAAKLDAQKSEFDALRAQQKSAFDSERKDLFDQLAAVARANEGLKAEAAAQVEKLNTQLNIWRDEANRSDVRFKNVDAQNRKLLQDCTALGQELSALKEASSRRIDDLTSRLTTANSDIEKKGIALKELINNFENAKNEIDRKERIVVALNEERGTLKKTVDTANIMLRDMKDDLTKKLDALNEQRRLLGLEPASIWDRDAERSLLQYVLTTYWPKTAHLS
ncbi:MAG: hypothetical protein LBQ43_00410 [Holosporales bacterium]|nr:hypothetical protein [Holosporales bacterium]